MRQMTSHADGEQSLFSVDGMEINAGERSGALPP